MDGICPYIGRGLECDLSSVQNFPVWLSGFVGRESEKAITRRLLASTRLLTLTGPGGSGKTRLALEIARDSCDDYPDCVWLVELGALAAPPAGQPAVGRIAQATAHALGMIESLDRPILERLIEHLAPLHLLLVLDNCEHLIDDCARFAHALLSGCPNLRILATSREPLRISGETVWPVPPLALPEWSQDQAVSDLLKSEAVLLFVERIRSVLPGFELTAKNAPSVFQICVQLDGIPLALEMAAARASVLSLVEMAECVDSAFSWLESADRLAPARQQTMRGALDWSYQLLQPEEQRLFRLLSVFIGGFSLQAAEQMCAADGINPDAVLALLYRLVSKSFVRHTNEPVSRYAMLEVVRQYGLEKLEQKGEEQTARERYLRWCLDFALKAENGVESTERGAWVAQVESELPNLRQAMAWSLTGGLNRDTGYQISNALSQFWQLRGYIREGLEWTEAALANTGGVTQLVLAQAYQSAAFLAQHLWDLNRAEHYIAKAVEIWRAEGEQERIPQGLNYLGCIYVLKQDFPRARQVLGESRALLAPLRPSFDMAVILMQMGEMAFMEGDYAQAEEHHTASLEMSEQVEHDLGSTRRMSRLAQISIARGDLNHAQTQLLEVIHKSRGIGDRWTDAMIMVAAVSLAAAQGRPMHAARCLGAAQVFVEIFGTNLWPVDRLIFENHQRLLLEVLGEKTYAAAVEEGRRQAANLDQAMSFVLDGLSADPQDGGRAGKEAFGGLTAREREVAELIAQGMNNAEIARALNVVVRTVETHITHILTKLNYTSRTQIAVWAASAELFKSPQETRQP